MIRIENSITKTKEAVAKWNQRRKDKRQAKIRAEMEQIKEAEHQIYGKGSWKFVDKCLDIIDKYKTESED